ncbi:MAG TPA: hypothetical protein ENI95_15505, partial [Chloroflexi bacterium]|nr:hypothetical protein [Chloroflexota bacterium]
MAKKSTQPRLTRKRLPRAQREARMQRMVLVGTLVVAAAVIGVIAFAFINEWYLIPRRAIATVNGEKITVAEFQERVLFDYYLQTGGQPLPAGMDASFFGQMTLDAMIEEIIIRQKAAEMGIEVSEEEVEAEMQRLFGYYADGTAPTSTSTPTPAGPTSTPTLTPTFVYTLTPTPSPTLEPGVTPTATPTITPTPSEPPTITPTLPPPPTREPMTEEDYNQALSGLLGGVSEFAGISEERARELIKDYARTQLLRERLMEALNLEADQTKIVVHAAHILVETEEEAQAILDRIEAGEEFEKL